MSFSQKLGVLTLIPKEDKDKYYLKNWRPISLLNVVYKLASGCIANRIKKVLSFVISENQKGFLSGRFIGENIRRLYDLILYTDVKDIPALLLLIDFEKAFDSISHEFITKVMSFFNFGPSIISWINILYADAFSSAQINGFFTERFKIERGCRQGDPLSPYIFLLCSEILNLMISGPNSFEGIKIDNMFHRIVQYADDTLLTLNGTEKDLFIATNIVDRFANISGLKINENKTKVIWIGKCKNKEDRMLPERNFHWVHEGGFKYLGIHFFVDLERTVQYNYYDKMEVIRKQMNSWRKHSLTVLGRIVVIKSHCCYQN